MSRNQAVEPDRFWALRKLPPFPAIATKLLQLLSNGDAAIQDVVRLIRADAAFSSELLRVANSPIHGLRSQVSSVQHAVVILGFDTVKSFAMAVSIKSFLRRATRIDILRRVWRHSLACALVSEELAAAGWKGADQSSRERAYTAGLLHDLGRLGLLVQYPREYANLLAVVEENPFDLLETERELFDIDHCEAGSWVAEAWSFPTEIREVAARHHEPPDKRILDLLNLVRSAVLLTDWLGFDVAPPRREASPAEMGSLLPDAARSWIEADLDAKRADITARLDSFD